MGAHVRARRFYQASFTAAKPSSQRADEHRQVRHYCAIDQGGERLLEGAITRMGLSARAHDRILKVSRTIADLEGAPQIQSKHVAEAVHYRSLDRMYWT